MVFDSGYIFKFPTIKSNWSQQDYIVDNDELICPNREPNQYFNPIKESIIYDPRCRHFYYTSLNSTFKITFIAPYKFSDDKYMNDIYIRTEHKEGKAQDVVLCMVINYYDFDAFRDKIDEYKELIEIMLLHYKNIYNVNAKNLNILYDSSYFISEFKSHIENNDTITTRKYSLNYFLIHLINILKNTIFYKN